MENTSLQYVKGVGPKKIKLLKKIGIETVEELLYYFPRYYEDRVEDEAIALVPGTIATIKGTILSSQNVRSQRGLVITKAAIGYEGRIVYLIWFNQGFLQKKLSSGKEIIVTGKINKSFGNIEMSVSDYQFADGKELIHAGRIVPVYSVTEDLTPKALRQIIKSALDLYCYKMKEFLPQDLLNSYQLMNLKDALYSIHFPNSIEEAENAKKRFIFEELFLLQLGIARVKLLRDDNKNFIKHNPNEKVVKGFIENLPFKLTKAQLKVLEDINKDMVRAKSMNRLIQGDVGSGKTIVALIALLISVSGGHQGALMAPTEILAEQHYLGLKELLNNTNFTICLLTGSTSKKERTELLSAINEGRVDIVVGTHALIQDDVEFKNLGLAITDEQHRFGVKQRAQLKDKGIKADVLVMTATPIPRTLAMTLYGDLDISIIDELPPGRKPVKTFWISQAKREDLYNFIKKQINEGRQAYIVCPLIEESEKLEVESATELAENLQKGDFSQFIVGLIHGRLKTIEKERIMNQFRKGFIDILVSTTVIEVGVNVPNASIMVIEDADRFGLAQLHQLRGRVGRGQFQSYCILIAEPKTVEGKRRMKVMEKTNDGFIIADEDLKLRGPGEFFGIRQSGLPELKIADLLKDISILEITRREAFNYIEKDPELEGEESKKLKIKLLEKFKDKFSYINIS